MKTIFMLLMLYILQITDCTGQLKVYPYFLVIIRLRQFVSNETDEIPVLDNMNPQTVIVQVKPIQRFVWKQRMRLTVIV